MSDANLGKQERIDKAYALAYEYEQKYGSCPQCVLASIMDVFGTVDDAVFKASHSLAGGGGISTTGTCGALVGGVLALSNKYGRNRENFGKGRFLDNHKLAKQLFDRFEAEYGSPICADVQTKVLGRAFNMWDKEDYAAFETAGGHVDKCPRVAGNVAKWVAEMMVELEEVEQKMAKQ
jgi:C_GCAxxG_C_C family probable redox protein